MGPGTFSDEMLEIVPPVIATLADDCVDIDPSPRFERAVVMLERSERFAAAFRDWLAKVSAYRFVVGCNGPAGSPASVRGPVNVPPDFGSAAIARGSAVVAAAVLSARVRLVVLPVGVTSICDASRPERPEIPAMNWP